MRQLFERIKQSAKTAAANFTQWARKKPTKRQVAETAVGWGALAAMAVMIFNNHVAGPLRALRAQSVIKESLRDRAAGIEAEVQKREEYEQAMERQKRLNIALHTRKYLDRFWKYMHTTDGPNLTRKEREAVEKFCKKHPIIPLTHLVATVENNVPHGERIEDVIQSHLTAGNTRIGAVLAIAHQHAQRNHAFRRAMSKLQQRGAMYSGGFAPPSTEFMTRALNDEIRGLPPDASGLLSRVDELWTGRSGRNKGVGNMLAEIHAFSPSHTPFLERGSFRQESALKWVYRPPADKR